MSLDTYANLQLAVADFLNRDDLAAQIPTFIALAEADMNRQIRHWRMERRATAPFNEPYELLPNDWLETISLNLPGIGALRLVSPQEMMDAKACTDDMGHPRMFRHTAGEIELWPVPNASTGTGELIYYGEIPALSDTNTVNWLLTHAPDAYLYGSLLQAGPYLFGDSPTASWGELYSRAIASLNAESESARTSGPLRMRAPR